MTVDEKTAKYVSEVEGVRTYFCSATCKNEFEENEKRYNKSSSSSGSNSSNCCCCCYSSK